MLMNARLKTTLLTIALGFTVTITGRSYAQTSNPSYRNFVEWCTNINTIDPAARITVEAVLDSAETEDCNRVQNLEELSLSETQITDLRPIAGLTNLQQLYISGTQVTDLRPIAGLTNLQEIVLSGNQITDLSAIVGLTNLREFYIRGTVSPASEGVINSLAARGVRVIRINE